MESVRVSESGQRTIDPIDEIRRISEGMANELGLKTEDDVALYMKELRKKRLLQTKNLLT